MASSSPITSPNASPSPSLAAAAAAAVLVVAESGLSVPSLHHIQ